MLVLIVIALRTVKNALVPLLALPVWRVIRSFPAYVFLIVLSLIATTALYARPATSVCLATSPPPPTSAINVAPDAKVVQIKHCVRLALAAMCSTMQHAILFRIVVLGLFSWAWSLSSAA